MHLLAQQFFAYKHFNTNAMTLVPFFYFKLAAEMLPSILLEWLGIGRVELTLSRKISPAPLKLKRFTPYSGPALGPMWRLS